MDDKVITTEGIEKSFIYCIGIDLKGQIVYGRSYWVFTAISLMLQLLHCCIVHGDGFRMTSQYQIMGRYQKKTLNLKYILFFLLQFTDFLLQMCCCWKCSILCRKLYFAFQMNKMDVEDTNIFFLVSPLRICCDIWMNDWPIPPRCLVMMHLGSMTFSTQNQIFHFSLPTWDDVDQYQEWNVDCFKIQIK